MWVEKANGEIEIKVLHFWIRGWEEGGRGEGGRDNYIHTVVAFDKVRRVLIKSLGRPGVEVRRVQRTC